MSFNKYLFDLFANSCKLIRFILVSIFSIFHDLYIDRNLANNIQTKLIAHWWHTIVRVWTFEYFGLTLTIRTLEIAHIFNNPNHINFTFLTETNLLPNINKGNFLRSSYYQRSIILTHIKELNNTDMFIWCSRRSIDHQKVQIAPIYIQNELFDQPCFTRSSPDHSIILVIKKEPNTHYS